MVKKKIDYLTVRKWNKMRIEKYGGSVVKLSEELKKSPETLRALFRRHGMYPGRINK